jgi:hypothetical protein
MSRPPIPDSVATGRVLLTTESVLWLLSGPIVIPAALWFIGQGDTNFSGAGIVIAVIVAILVGLSITGIWSAEAIRRLTGGPRITGLVLASLGLIIGIISTIGGTQTFVTSNGDTFRSSPLPGIGLIVVNALIIWAIGVSGSARAAFGGLRPAGYPMAPPPGYGPAPGYPPPSPPAP